MPLSSKVGTFQMNASTGNQSVTGVGFQPKAIIFMATPNTTDIDSPDLTSNNYGTIGFTDGTNQYAGAWFSPNAAALESAYFMLANNRCIIGMLNASDTFSASIVSLDSDGFTVNVNDAPSDTWQIGYLALGGDDLSAFAGTFNSSSSATQAITGLGFQPSALIGFNVAGSTAFSATTVTNTSVFPTFGVSDGTANYCVSNYIRNGGVATTNRHCVQRNNSFLADLVTDAGVYSFECTVSSFDADGFTLNYSNTSASNEKCIYLALGGVSAKLLTYALNTSAGAQSVTGVGFQPGSLITASSGQPGYNTVSSNGDGAKIIIGMGSAATERFSFGSVSIDNVSSGTSDHYQHSAHLGRVGNYVQGTEEEFDLGGFTSDGFDLDVETALGSNASSFFALALEGGFDEGGGNPGSGSGSTSSKDASFMFGWIGV